ncbi:hypothetical protein [Enterococcus casseliflavus]|uniref:hypothetical protein n=1 Tax=Enterococcus casseliflavus TaxID=37734 RepID=UPI001BCC258A
MKTATTMLYEILNNADDFKSIDFYTNKIPESNQTLPSLPVGRIVELQGDYDNYASDKPNVISFDVQVDIWLQSQADVEKYYYKLDSYLRENYWINTYTLVEEDPDLQGSKRIVKRYNGTFQLEM